MRIGVERQVLKNPYRFQSDSEKGRKDENGSGQAIIFRVSEIILDRGDKYDGY